MKRKDRKNNVYSLYKKENPYPKYLIGVLLLFFLALVYVNNMKFETSLKLEGVYTCEKTCLIKTVLPLKEIKELDQTTKIKMKDSLYPLKVKSFGKIEIIENKGSIQEVSIEIPKQEFYEKQTIELEILKKEENILKSIIASWKGGE